MEERPPPISRSRCGPSFTARFYVIRKFDLTQPRRRKYYLNFDPHKTNGQTREITMSTGDTAGSFKALEDVREIINVLNLYGLTIDSQRWELFDEVFHPDVFAYYLLPICWNNREEIRKSMADS